MKRHAIRGAIALACLLVTLAGALAQVTGAQITTQANSAFRDFVTDGVSASGAWNPRKSDIRALFGSVGSAITTAQGPVAASRLPFETAPTSVAADKVVSPAWLLGWAPTLITSTPAAGALTFQPSTSAALSSGVVGVAVSANGTGGTNGTFDLAFSGGGGTGAAGRFTVAGGAIVPSSIVIRSTGSGYTSAPTVSFAASSGLTGATATATTAVNAPPGSYFAVPGSTADVLYSLFTNTAGSATSLGSAPTTAALRPIQTQLVGLASPAATGSTTSADNAFCISTPALADSVITGMTVAVTAAQRALVEVATLNGDNTLTEVRSTNVELAAGLNTITSLALEIGQGQYACIYPRALGLRFVSGQPGTAYWMTSGQVTTNSARTVVADGTNQLQLNFTFAGESIGKARTAFTASNDNSAYIGSERTVGVTPTSQGSTTPKYKHLLSARLGADFRRSAAL